MLRLPPEKVGGLLTTTDSGPLKMKSCFSLSPSHDIAIPSYLCLANCQGTDSPQEQMSYIVLTLEQLIVAFTNGMVAGLMVPRFNDAGERRILFSSRVAYFLRRKILFRM